MTSDTTPTATPPLTRVRVFDLETTGIDTETARIVTAFIGDVVDDGEGGVSVDGDMGLLVNPGIEIPERATQVHGITTEHAAAHGIDPGVAVTLLAASIAEAAGQGIPMVVFNAPYDFTLLDRELRRHGKPPLNMDGVIVIDPFVIDKFVDKYRKGKRTLSAVTGHYGVRLDEAHTARADAVATGQLALLLMRHPLVSDLRGEALNEAQRAAYLKQSTGFEAHRRRTDPDFTTKKHWPITPA
ncbi:exonuclease domain-containing protein [Pseudoclavibacter sp. VKM Ac-2888]|uniref:exonuclease domain-containing protein n=1 Tax=Pseudoclavibacter sp. VKM Ac-2888 TaxID=2783830 RepID=UPI00188A25C2|nr:exonuclease domain-containing protein [Pseudoclavibacter sp. VKM Ac-2888]MBF4549486.1 3'-5' exonuclease [Pseudoclavibacter sp. VKM Ac-2888]